MAETATRRRGGMLEKCMNAHRSWGQRLTEVTEAWLKNNHLPTAEMPRLTGTVNDTDGAGFTAVGPAVFDSVDRMNGLAWDRATVSRAGYCPTTKQTWFQVGNGRGTTWRIVFAKPGRMDSAPRPARVVSRPQFGRPPRPTTFPKPRPYGG